MTPLQFATRAARKVILPMAPRSFRLPFQYYLMLIEGCHEPELRHLDAICQNRNVAIDVSANLGLYSYKLSHLFQRVFAFANVLGPSFPRCQDPKRLPRLYLLLVGGTVMMLTPTVILTYLFPSAFLWLFGGRYSGLQNECVWVIAAASLSQIGVVMWNLNSGKAWILVQAHGFIPAILSAQALAAAFLNLRQFHDAIIFNLVVCAAPLPIYAVDAWIGLRTRFNTKGA